MIISAKATTLRRRVGMCQRWPNTFETRRIQAVGRKPIDTGGIWYKVNLKRCQCGQMPHLYAIRAGIAGALGELTYVAACSCGRYADGAHVGQDAFGKVTGTNEACITAARNWNTDAPPRKVTQNAFTRSLVKAMIN